MMLFRRVRLSDAAELAEIHRPYVEKTSITFMCKTPTRESFEEKIKAIEPLYPFIVCEEDGKPVAFAYASQLRPHDAYQWDVELSVYVDDKHHRQGIGSALYVRLLRLLKIQGFLNAYAVITVPNEASMGLHQRFGFRQVGMFPSTGFKLGAWRDVVWLCLPLGEFPAYPVPPTPFSKFGVSELEVLLM